MKKVIVIFSIHQVSIFAVLALSLEQNSSLPVRHLQLGVFKAFHRALRLHENNLIFLYYICFPLFVPNDLKLALNGKGLHFLLRFDIVLDENMLIVIGTINYQEDFFAVLSDQYIAYSVFRSHFKSFIINFVRKNILESCSATCDSWSLQINR